MRSDRFRSGWIPNGALPGNLIRFGLVGLLTTGLNFVVFVLLVRLGLHYLIAATAGWGGGLFASFVLNRTFTFALPGPATIGEGARFFGTYVFQLLLGSAGYVVLIDGLGFDPVHAFFINLILVSLFSFTCMKLYVFRPAAAPARLSRPHDA